MEQRLIITESVTVRMKATASDVICSDSSRINQLMCPVQWEKLDLPLYFRVIKQAFSCRCLINWQRH